MKHFYLFVASILAVVTISSCDRDNKVLYAIQVDGKVMCTSAEQVVEVKYNVHENVINSDVQFSVTSSEGWVSVEDCSTVGVVKLRVEQNEGENRSSTIKLSAPGCVSASFTLMQYGTPPEVANHTLMFYFFGTSLGRYFNTNVEDAVKAIDTGILGNNNRVVIFRQESATKAYISELCYDIEGDECIEQRIDEVTLDSGRIISPDAIGEYISMMAEHAPAERYGIVFAGHGQGWVTREIITSDRDIQALSLGYNPWMPAVGAEVTRAFGESNVQVDIAELAEGIELSGVALDYMLFDACFMANIEAIYDLRGSANYIIASPCEIMGKGFPYHRTLPYLFRDEGMTTDYVGAAESYYNYYKNEYTGSSRCGSISVFDCSQIEALANATRGVMRSAKGESEYDASTLQTYEGQKVHQFYDFGQWVEVVATDNEALESFNEAMSECIIATYTLNTFYSAYGSYGTYTIDTDVYTGVTTSAPSEAYPNGWRETSWYNEVIKLEN